MRNHRWPAILATLVCACSSPSARADDCPVFLLARGPDGASLRREIVPQGETRVWTTGAGSDLLDLVLPVGPGGSGSLLKHDETALSVVRCTEEGVSHRLRYPDGRQVERPVRALDDLRSQDIRVSVVEEGGARSAFVIEAYDRVTADDGGPVQNLLADAVTLSPGDVVVTTDTYPRRVSARVAGVVELEVSGHLFARGSLPGHEAAWFLVDTGGAETLVTRSFLPGDVEVEPAHRVEYSARGRRELEYAPGGATGQVEGILGHATLPRLAFGTIELEDVQVAVAESLPDLFDRPVAGILGLDLLERGERLILRLPANARGVGELELTAIAPSEGIAPDSFEIPFTVANRHLTVAGGLGDQVAHFVLDTGAPDVFVDRETARAAGLPERGGERRARGIDGGSVASSACEIPRLTLEGASFQSVPCRTGPLPVFASFRGAEQGIGLIGNSFLGRFEQVMIDFGRERIRFVFRPTEAAGE